MDFGFQVVALPAMVVRHRIVPARGYSSFSRVVLLFAVDYHAAQGVGKVAAGGRAEGRCWRHADMSR